MHPVQRGTVLQYRVSEGGVEDAQGTVRRHGCHEEAYREASKEIPPEERHNLVGGNPRLSDARSDGPTVTPTGM